MSHFKNACTLYIVSERKILLTLSIVVSFFVKGSGCTWQASHLEMCNAIAKSYKCITIDWMLIKSQYNYFFRTIFSSSSIYIFIFIYISIYIYIFITVTNDFFKESKMDKCYKIRDFIKVLCLGIEFSLFSW